MLINEQNSFMLNFLTSIGYKLDENEFKSLTNQETGEIANLVCSQSQNGNIAYTYQFEKCKIILEQDYSEIFKEDLIRLVTPEMTYRIRNARYQDFLPNRSISFTANNGFKVELDFNTIGDDFDRTTMTTIKHCNSGGSMFLSCKIYSDLTHLIYQTSDSNVVRYTNISVEGYFEYIVENLKSIFGNSISKQEYDTINMVVSGLSDNVRIMLNLPIINSQIYRKNLQYRLSHLNEKYAEKISKLLREIDNEREEYLQLLDNYDKTLGSLDTNTHRSI